MHQDEITDLADRRFNSDKNLNAYLTTFTDYNTLFSSLLIPSDIKSTLIEDYNIIVDPELRTSFTTGLEFGLIKEQDSDTVVGYVSGYPYHFLTHPLRQFLEAIIFLLL